MDADFGLFAWLSLALWSLTYCYYCSQCNCCSLTLCNYSCNNRSLLGRRSLLNRRVVIILGVDLFSAFY